MILKAWFRVAVNIIPLRLKNPFLISLNNVTEWCLIILSVFGYQFNSLDRFKFYYYFRNYLINKLSYLRNGLIYL